MRIPPWAEDGEERYRSQCVLPRQGRIIDKDMCNMEQQTRFDEEFKIITKQVDGVVDGDQMSRLRFKGVAL